MVVVAVVVVVVLLGRGAKPPPPPPPLGKHSLPATHHLTLSGAARLPSGYTKDQINRYGSFCLPSLRAAKHFKHGFPDAFVGRLEGQNSIPEPTNIRNMAPRDFSRQIDACFPPACTWRVLWPRNKEGKRSDLQTDDGYGRKKKEVPFFPLTSESFLYIV